MATEVLLPKLAFSMEDGKVAQWLIADGGNVKQGEALYSLEGEKAVEDIDSPASGVLRIKVEAGVTCLIGTVLAVIE